MALKDGYRSLQGMPQTRWGEELVPRARRHFASIHRVAKSTLTRVRVASKEQRVPVQGITPRLEEDAAGCADNGVTIGRGTAS